MRTFVLGLGWLYSILNFLMRRLRELFEVSGVGRSGMEEEPIRKMLFPVSSERARVLSRNKSVPMIGKDASQT